MTSRTIHSSHWGTYYAVTDECGRLTGVEPAEFDRSPTDLYDNIPGSVHHRTRITRPAIRRGWLTNGPGPDTQRGDDSYVEVDWPALEKILSDELIRVYGSHGTRAVFGGSYGWSSAGRFHHAQSQVHRFLNALGGYVRSVNDYSTGASTVVMKHVVGADQDAVHATSMWREIHRHTDLIVSFGGLPMKNLFVSPGGNSSHDGADELLKLAAHHTDVVVFSPLRDDAHAEIAAQWHAIRPGTDCAVMLALAHEIVVNDLHDTEFLDRYTAGSARFIDYVLGAIDGEPKTPAWAQQQTGVAAGAITSLALRMARGNTLINVMWSLQRGEFGEQPPWMALALAALIGQIGKPGCGFAHGLGSMGDVGSNRLAIGEFPTLRQGTNQCDRIIPVSRITDMLLRPGERFDYNGGTYRYPEVKLAYWAGGNPFHHQQNLFRLQRAMQRLDTFVVHESYWTATAKHADIVVPSTISLERNDIGSSRRDFRIVAMKRALLPYAESRNDFDIFAAIARKVTGGDAFREGLTADEWVRRLYDDWAATVAGRFTPPAFDDFWQAGWVELPTVDAPTSFLADFVADPAGRPLHTPSGKIELFSAVVDAFGYAGTRGHPSWFPPAEIRDPQVKKDYPIALMANQPKTRLHSQLDVGETSQASKIAGREPVRINARDAADRGVADGDVVEIWSRYGTVLAGAHISEAIPRGVAQLSTGAWFDPVRLGDKTVCASGNPNALTSDASTSEFAQSSAGAYVNVNFTKYVGALPPLTAYQPPVFTEIGDGLASVDAKQAR